MYVDVGVEETNDVANDDNIDAVVVADDGVEVVEVELGADVEGGAEEREVEAWNFARSSRNRSDVMGSGGVIS